MFKAQNATQVIRVDLVLQEMIAVVAADLSLQAGERCFPVGVGKYLVPPARAKTDVALELISPMELCEWFQQHREKIAA